LKKVINYLVYLIAKSVSVFFQILPERVARGIGVFLGNLAYLVDFKHRRIALDNLKLAFGETYTERERRAIARQNFVNLAKNFVVFCRIPKIRRNTLAKTVKFHGKKPVMEALERGKGIIFFLAHLGNWEVMVTLPLLLKQPLYAVGKWLRNPYLDRWISGIREYFGVEIVSSVGAAKAVLRLLRENKMVGILADQRARMRDAVIIDFFGHPAPTLQTPAFFALKTGAAVIPVSHRREGDVHHITAHPAFEITRTGDLKHDIVVNTQRFHRFLEDEIRKDPTQWFWVHRRWQRREGHKRHHRANSDSRGGKKSKP